MIMTRIEEFKALIGSPLNYSFEHSLELIKRYSFEDIDCELYMQANGIRPDGEITYQRVVMALPKKLDGKMPAVVVPFYYPDAALGFDLESGEALERYIKNPTMHDIVRHGYIAISADAYHLTYANLSLPRDDFSRWQKTAEVFNSEHPEWSGIGKLIFDTQLLLDICESDPRIDSERIGIAGHSLGGKMAFYTGCLDERVKVILASDFGIGLDSTNWDSIWYWGDKINVLKEKGLDNTVLLSHAAPKPFCLIAGQYDNEESRQTVYSIEEYKDCPSKILVIDHRSGHRPPKYASEAGYYFLDSYLK